MAEVTKSAGRTIYVRSQITDRMTAWHVRDFVRALDEHSIPNSTMVTADKNTSTLHTTGLSAQHREQTETDRTWIAAETAEATGEDPGSALSCTVPAEPAEYSVVVANHRDASVWQRYDAFKGSPEDPRWFPALYRVDGRGGGWTQPMRWDHLIAQLGRVTVLRWGTGADPVPAKGDACQPS